ncbi:MAG: hypothetical protein AAF242_15085, partial [Bacteroidota bacterium]
MLKGNLKSTLLIYLEIILIWVAALFVLMFLRSFGADPGAQENPMRGLRPLQRITILFSVGTLAGIMYTSIELLFDRPYFQRHSYGRIILSKIIFSFFAVKFMMAFGITMTNNFAGTWMERAEIVEILRSKIYWVIFVYFLLVAILISFVRMVSQKFGPGVLWNMFIGRTRLAGPKRSVRTHFAVWR